MFDSKNFEVVTAATERLSVSPGATAPGRGRKRNGSSGRRLRRERTCWRSRALTASIHRDCLPWPRKALACGLVAPISSTAAKWSSSRFDAMTNDIVEIVVGDV